MLDVMERFSSTKNAFICGWNTAHAGENARLNTRSRHGHACVATPGQPEHVGTSNCRAHPCGLVFLGVSWAWVAERGHQCMILRGRPQPVHCLPNVSWLVVEERDF